MKFPFVPAAVVSALVLAGCAAQKVTPAAVACGDLACVAEAAKTCAPTRAPGRKETISSMGMPLVVNYVIGIRGFEGNDCMLYYKVRSVEGGRDPSPGTYNYASCNFHDAAWMSAYLAKDAFIGDWLLPDMVHFEPNGPQGRCDWLTMPDAYHSPTEYPLVSGEEIRDDTEDFTLRLDSMEFEKNATLTVHKGDGRETFLLLPGETKSIFGYRVTLEGFGQSNLAWETGGEDFHEMARVAVSL